MVPAMSASGSERQGVHIGRYASEAIHGIAYFALGCNLGHLLGSYMLDVTATAIYVFTLFVQLDG